MKKNIEELGFDTWLELYEALKAANLHNHKEADLEWPNGSSETVQLGFIKSKAFDEIYPTLPSSAAIEVVLEIVNCSPIVTEPRYRTPLLEFFKKLPTKAND